MAKERKNRIRRNQRRPNRRKEDLTIVDRIKKPSRREFMTLGPAAIIMLLVAYWYAALREKLPFIKPETVLTGSSVEFVQVIDDVAEVAIEYVEDLLNEFVGDKPEVMEIARERLQQLRDTIHVAQDIDAFRNLILEDDDDYSGTDDETRNTLAFMKSDGTMVISKESFRHVFSEILQMENSSELLAKLMIYYIGHEFMHGLAGTPQDVSDEEYDYIYQRFLASLEMTNGAMRNSMKIVGAKFMFVRSSDPDHKMAAFFNLEEAEADLFMHDINDREQWFEGEAQLQNLSVFHQWVLKLEVIFDAIELAGISRKEARGVLLESRILNQRLIWLRFLGNTLRPDWTEDQQIQFALELLWYFETGQQAQVQSMLR